MNASDEALTTTPTAASKSLKVTKEEKAQWVRRFEQSGLSLREFSAQNGLGHVTLWRWVNKSREQAVAVSATATPAFTEILFPGSGQPGPWVAEWSLPNGAVLRLSKDVPVTLLQELLRVC